MTSHDATRCERCRAWLCRRGITRRDLYLAVYAERFGRVPLRATEYQHGR